MIANELPERPRARLEAALDYAAAGMRLKANIPAELRELRRWVVWRYEDRVISSTGEVKPTKVPYQLWLTKSAKASSTNTETWGYFGEALTVLELGEYDGLGFILAKEDPYTFIDLDHCRDPQTGRVEEWALQLVRRLNSYTELSPSGTGLHILVRGKLPGVDRRKGSIEMYDSGRFATMTGRVFERESES